MHVTVTFYLGQRQLGGGWCEGGAENRTLCSVVKIAPLKPG